MRCKRRGYFTLKDGNKNFKTSPEYLEECFSLRRSRFGFLPALEPSRRSLFVCCCMFVCLLMNRAFPFDIGRLFEFQ